MFFEISLLDNYLLSRWSTGGCNRTRSFHIGEQDYITCECDHLTSFGVLLNIYEESFDAANSYELSVISQIGCYISIGSLIITILALSFLR